MVLCDHELVYCSRKNSLLKLNEHYEIGLWKITQIRSIKYPGYSNHNCVNKSYQHFVLRFCLQLMLFHQSELYEWNLTSNLGLILISLMIFEAVIRTIKNSNNMAMKLIRIILNMQNLHFKNLLTIKLFLPRGK